MEWSAEEGMENSVWIVRFENGLVQLPPGNRRTQRQTLHTLAWNETAREFGIWLSNSTQITAEGNSMTDIQIN